MMHPKVTVVGCLNSLSSLADNEWNSGHAPSWLYIRGDRVGEIDPSWLRSRSSATLVYSLGHPGRTDNGALHDRRARLQRAASQYDLVELDADLDIDASIVYAVPAERRILSWRGEVNSSSDLGRIIDRITSTPARYYSVVIEPADTAQSLAPIELLHRIRRTDTFAWASGVAGTWTRIVAPRLGAPIVFGNLAERDPLGEPGELSLKQLASDYGFPALSKIDAIYGIVGSNVSRSLSPRLHNTAYAALGLPAVFLPFQSDCLRSFRSVLDSPFFVEAGMPVKGLTIAAPHKELASELAESRDPLVDHARSSNIHVRNHCGWIAGTTDPDGVIPALQDLGFDFCHAAVAIVGCGGSGRAIAAVLREAGSDVTLVNRTISRGQFAGRLLSLPFVPLDEFDPRGYAVVINATPIGSLEEKSPFSSSALSKNTIVVDQVYREGETPLVAAARARGCPTVNGRQVLLAQVRRQFQRMVGANLPLDAARDVLGFPGTESMLAAAH
jgi:3-dehydroquinate dehydratase / shikimate dehydrogenase